MLAVTGCLKIRTDFFAFLLQIRKIWDIHNGSDTWVVGVKITDIWRNLLFLFSRLSWKSSSSKVFLKLGTFLADYMASCCRTNIRNFKILLLGPEVVTFLADYMTSCCRTNIRNFKILLLGLVTLIHNPTTANLCQKFWRTSTSVTLNIAAIK